MRYGIIGTGAIGGYYGAKLARAGQEVHFLLHSDYENVKQHGLQAWPLSILPRRSPAFFISLF